jgi:uncharacterized protein involved in exopolysaccharide biosynthesis
MTSPYEPSADAESQDEAALFDYAYLWRQLGFTARSIQRHRWLCLGIFLSVAVMGSGLAASWPRTYHVRTKILAQRNQVMASLGNPHRVVPTESDAPTRAASETVLRRDNLVSLVKQTNLVDNWDAKRVPLLRLKDRVVRIFRGPTSDEDKLEALILLLERRLKVTTGEGTVEISIDWPNDQMAYQLVEAAQQNFLEARHVTEVSTIEEAISILEAHADNVHGAIERTLVEIEKLSTGSVKQTTTVKSHPLGSNLGLGEAAPEQELKQIKFLLRAKRRAITDLEEFRQKRLAELQNQLAEQKVVYSDQHPVIVDTQQRIAALNQESPQITQLKADEQELLAEARRRGAKGDLDSLTDGPVAKASRSETTPSAPSVRLSEDSPQLAYAREQLRIASDTYQDILLRIDGARIELDTSRAAFKYRYSVINPAQFPKQPDKPNVFMMVVASIVGGLVLAVIAAFVQDHRKGRLIEAWQVERLLGIPLLAEVETP